MKVKLNQGIHRPKMRSKDNWKVAIVHDWLVGGGAERVVYELHKMFPDAPIYTSYCSPEWRGKLDGQVVTGFLQHWPFSVMRKFLPLLRIWWFTHLKFDGYDLVISSSGNGEAKGIKVPKGTRHICYCHSPTHFYWRHYEQYMHQPGFGPGNPLARLGLRLLVGPLRRWDLAAAKRPDYFIANSSHIQADIRKYYGREAIVIHPPVDVSRFEHERSKKQRHGFVTVGRQVPYKHVDIIIEACNRLGLPLTVIGRGPEHSRLVKMAGPTVTCAPQASDAEVAAYLSSAKAFLFAAFEDSGITPVEALAAGTPVIAYKAGGALDYIVEGKTGLFFAEQTADSLCQALERFPEYSFQPLSVQRWAAQFSTEQFETHMRAFIQKVMETT